eukprot:CAMPEP_0182812326 /NCGR_PEP_ID=MMETSP0006_2-20121128/8745_1 /TAXON_ID=97485 /ORGANISM="Prymnesium parvum, Strain Texoma1" /LENGTH=129 /DNA_ID=CAMNT_0024938345 /DNA_START=651 /DNA_END=1035 /DNA_ORIENTATION=-
MTCAQKPSNPPQIRARRAVGSGRTQWLPNNGMIIGQITTCPAALIQKHHSEMQCLCKLADQDDDTASCDCGREREADSYGVKLLYSTTEQEARSRDKDDANHAAEDADRIESSYLLSHRQPSEQRGDRG